MKRQAEYKCGYYVDNKFFEDSKSANEYILIEEMAEYIEKTSIVTIDIVSCRVIVTMLLQRYDMYEKTGYSYPAQNDDEGEKNVE